LVIFFAIAMTAIVNAFNLIDGLNGLLLITFISILSCLYMMAGMMNDLFFLELFKFIIIICLIQLIFNFPIAKIFAGDLGAYSFGFIIGILNIILFGKYSVFLTWQAVLILFYPTCEMIFTVIRRFLQSRNPLNADREHLHQLIYDYINTRFNLNKNLANSLTTIIMFPIWLFSPLWIYYRGPLLPILDILMGILLNLTIYLAFYFFVKKNLTKNKLFYF